MAIKALRGTYDIFPPQSKLWQKIENLARELFSLYGYGEIRTPIFEETKLFSRSIGENTDIVSKEMYTFQDRKGRSITLRPEATAPVVRAYLQHNMQQLSQICKLSYIGPMFRYERPQAGRNRQFYQLGTELIGSTNPYYDAESIALAYEFISRLGINDPVVKINSVGDAESKSNYGNLIKDYLAPKIDSMCGDCKIRIEKNPLRVLDCKNPSCKEYLAGAPSLLDSLSESSKTHFEQVRKYLEAMEIPYTIDNYLVRGLDYYTDTIFEIIHSNLGSQDALGGGGRYNNLVQEMGGPSTGAVGFAFGIDRLVLVLEALADQNTQNDDDIDLFILNLDESVFTQHVKLVQKLRQKNIKADICTESKSMKAQMRNANKVNAKLVIIRGQNEIDNNVIKIKNMNDKTEETISITHDDSLLNAVLERIN